MSEYKLSEIITLVGGGTPKTTNDSYWGGDIPWISVVDFNNDNRYVHSTEKTITQAGLENSSTKILPKGALILSARGTVGALAQLAKPMAFNQSCYGIVAKEQTNNNFLYYLLKTIVSDLKAKGHGSVFNTITRDTFDSIEISLPPIDEQKRIADILGVFDDKIELLQQQNKTLEEMAKAIFKSWFVNFDIVKAKASLSKTSISTTPNICPPCGENAPRGQKGEYLLKDITKNLCPPCGENARIGQKGEYSPKDITKNICPPCGENAPVGQKGEYLLKDITENLCPPCGENTPVGGKGGNITRQAYIPYTDIDCGALEHPLTGCAHFPHKGDREQREWTKEKIMQEYHLTEELYNLFPSSFEDSPLGPIPATWQLKSLSAIAEFLNGLALQKYPAKSENNYLPVIKIAELRNGVSVSSDRATADLPAQYIINSGDILFSWSGSLMVKIWPGTKGALNQHLFKVSSKEYPKWFYYLWVSQHMPFFIETAADKATTMGHIQRKHLDFVKVFVPPNLTKFSDYFENILNKIINNNKQVQTLTELRDNLLPRLISGKIRV